MKLGNYSKFVLLMVHLSHIVKSNKVIENRPLTTNVSSNVREWEKYPYMVLIFIYEDPYDPMTPYNERACTGTLIRNDLVLTLASCLLFYYRDDPDPDVTTVMERPSRQKLHVHQIHVNPNYYTDDRFISKAHDIAILIVEKSSKQTFFPRLPTRLDNFEDIKDTCVLGGYGYGKDKKVDIGRFKSWRMNETVVEVITSRSCKAGGQRVCVHFDDLMPCKNGDFGGPLVCGGVLFAINSPRYNNWGMECLDYHIATFYPVYTVETWIQLIMEAPTSSLEWMSNPWYMLLLCLGVFCVMTVIYYGLVQLLQKSLDPDEDAMQMEPTDLEEDEESWYESQWNTRAIRHHE